MINYNRYLNALLAKDWLLEGWALFKKNPVIWIVILLLFNIVYVISGVSFSGRLVAALILPVLAGGIYYNAHCSKEGERVAVSNLFSQFGRAGHLKQLLVIGVIGMVVAALHYCIQTYLGEDPYDPGRALSFGFVTKDKFAAFSEILGAVLSGIWVVALLFSVPLVVINNERAIPALISSVKASFSNAIVIAVFYVAVAVLTIIAVIPVGLGLLVLVPVLFCANYLAFNSIFIEGLSTPEADRAVPVEGATYTSEERAKYKSGAVILFRIGLALVLLAIVIGSFTYNSLATGVKTMGTVVESHSHRSASSRQTSYTYTFSFEDKEGTQRQAETSTHTSVFLDNGEQVEILYDPDDPSDVSLTNLGTLWTLPLFLIALGLFMAWLAHRAKQAGMDPVAENTIEP